MTTTVNASIPLARPSTDERELAAVAAVLESGWLAGQGPRCAELEAGFRELTGREHAIAVNNCTAGLHLALVALGVQPGDEVLVADYTFPATGHAVLYCGATPVVVDVRPDIGTLDVDAARRALTERTKGIIVVDALGIPADWDQIEALAAEHDLFVLEDAACGAGGSYRGRPSGSFGDAAVFSLHARKGITCGEGGVVVTDSAEVADRVRKMTCFGMQSAFSRQSSDALVIPSFPELGYNYKLSDILAAIAVVQLSKLDGFIKGRQAIADRYAALLADVDGVSAPVVPADRQATWQTYAVTLADDLDRGAVVGALKEAGIGSTIGTYALHAQPVYGERHAPCPGSAHLFAHHLALPMHADVTPEDQERIVAVLAQAIAQQRAG